MKTSLFLFTIVTAFCLLGNPLFSQSWQTNGSNIYYNSGNVGINLSNPARPLHIGSTTQSEIIRLQDLDSYGADAKAVIGFYKADHTRLGFVGYGSGSNNYLQLFSDAESGIGFYTNGNNLRLTVHKYGNIGIGTGSPDAPLHIFKGTGELLKLQDSAGSGLQASPKIGFYDSSNDQLGQIGFSPSNDDFRFITKVGTGIRIGDFGATRMYLASDGKVGIGTVDVPNDFLLAIDGKVICEELKVQLSSSWPDYVFAPDYDLAPLSEVEESIKANGHLPGIPSATEIAENGGIELGDMQRLMMEKIEELTLHLIELEKENHKLQDRVILLEKGNQVSN